MMSPSRRGAAARLLALSLLALLAPTQAGLVAPGANILRRRAPPRRACVVATTDPFADVADTDELTLDEDEYEEEVMVLDEDEAAAWAQPPSSPPPDEADGWAEPMASAEQAAPGADAPSRGADVADSLGRLARLHEQKLLTSEEYTLAKREVLGGGTFI